MIPAAERAKLRARAPTAAERLRAEQLAGDLLDMRGEARLAVVPFS